MFETGEKVYVKRIGGDWTPSEIILNRENLNQELEYFVHYDGYNRRLDEWVSLNRIISKSSYEKQNENFSAYNKFESPNKKMTRQQRRKFNEMNHVQKTYAEMDPTTAALEKDYINRTNIKYINKVILGENEINTWYYSPYPGDYEKISSIFVCEKCLKYMALESTYICHMNSCPQVMPPGRRIYLKDNIAVNEIDGNINKLYCQNLCLLGKFFLDHKTLYFDVGSFLFYVVFELCSENEFHITSYFSKEKQSMDNYNVACILTLPPYQRKGYGKFLISLSYQLSKLENKIGTPEKPLSDLGKMSYRSYWSYLILDYLRKNPAPVLTIEDLSYQTGIARDDIIETLQMLNLLKYWKGNYVSCFSFKTIEEHFKTGNFKPPLLTMDPTCLTLNSPQPST